MEKINFNNVNQIPAEPEEKPVRIQTPREIYDALSKFVIGQEKAKRKSAIGAYNHIKRIIHYENTGKQLLRKSNMLFYGPTGCGKTHIARTLAQVLEMPFLVVDATDYTEAGYYGKDVETMIGELLLKTQSVKLTERSIIFIDEIDKIAAKSGGMRTGAGNRDIGGEGVQQALLKLLEGKTIYAPINVTQHWNKHDFVPVDVTNILFICAGAFSDMELISESEVQGFSQAEYKSVAAERKPNVADFRKYGLIPEFLGRLPIQVGLTELSENELYQVLTIPPDSVLNEYIELLRIDNIKLKFNENTFRPVISTIKRQKLGARALRSVMEDVLEDIMFHAPDKQGQVIELDCDYVQDRVRILYP